MRKRRTILIATAHDELCESLSLSFRSNGDDVRALNSIDGLLDYLAWTLEADEAGPVDAIVCDLVLGDKGAVHVLDAIERAGLEIPVIGINRDTGHELRSAAIARGCYDVVNTPASVRELVRLSAEAMKSSSYATPKNESSVWPSK